MKSRFFKHFGEYGTRTFISSGEYFEGTPPDEPLTSLLVLNRKKLKQFTKDLLEAVELSEDTQILMSEFSRGINAFLQFQDILEYSLDEDTSPIFGRHYCYYESLIYIRESAVSWLDKNVLAAITLLRPFLELSVLHLYWYQRCKLATYKPFYEWLTKNKGDKGKPSFLVALDCVLNNMPVKGYVDEKRIKDLKQVLKNLYITLCSYHHTPKMDESLAAKSGGFGSLSIESFYYYLHIANILLYQIIYLYILNYPMSLFPVNRYEKWGYNKGPVGLFFDKSNYARIEVFINQESCSRLKQLLKNVPDVESLTSWFTDASSLSNEDLEKNWGQILQEHPDLIKNNYTDIRKRLAVMKAFRRSEAWAFNYGLEQTREPNISDELSDKLRKRIRNW